MVTNQTVLKRNAGAFGKAQCGRDPGVRHRNYNVRRHIRFLRQLAAERLAGAIDRVTVDLAVRAREVDVLKDAHGRLDFRERIEGMQPFLVDQDQFSGLNIPDRLGADQIEGAGLRGHHPGIADLPQRQRPKAIRIARGDQTVIGQKRHGKRAAHLLKRVDHPVEQGIRAGMSDQMDDHLAVGGGLEDRAVGLKFVPDHLRVDQIPVVGQGQIAEGKVDHDRLGVLEIAGAGGRIAVVPDCRTAREPLQALFREDVCDQPHRLLLIELVTITGHDSGAFLPAVLERVQAEIHEVCRFLVAVDADHRAFVMKLVGRRTGGVL